MKRFWPFGWFRSKDETPKKLKIEKKPLSRNGLLSYECLRAILEFMDGNQRLDAFQRIPNIRVSEKLLPLSLDFLSFGANEMIINNIKHEFGIIRGFHPGHEIPQQIRRYNEKGGTPYDMDEFGLEERIEPGTHIGIYEEDEEVLLTREERIEDLPWLKEQREVTAEVFKRFPTDQYRDELNGYDNAIFSVTLLIENRPGPFDSFLQYTKSLTDDTKLAVMRRKYQPSSKSMFPTFKKLVYDLLDGRKEPIKVKKLGVSDINIDIPFPPNVKFKIKELSISESVEIVLNKLLPFIDESSFPLDLLEIGWSDSPGNNLGHPVIQSAKFLVLKGEGGLDVGDFDAQFADIPKNVHVVDEVCVRTPGSFPYNRLVRFWLQHPPEIGKRLSAGFSNESCFTWEMNSIRSNFNVTGERSFTIPMTDEAQIRVDSKLMDPENSNSYEQSHMMIFEVVPVERNV